MSKFIYNQSEEFKARLNALSGIACCSPLGLDIQNMFINDYFDADWGLVGEIAFAIFGFLMLRSSCRIMRKRDEDNYGYIKSTANTY